MRLFSLDLQTDCAILSDLELPVSSPQYCRIPIFGALGGFNKADGAFVVAVGESIIVKNKPWCDMNDLLEIWRSRLRAPILGAVECL